MSVTPMHRKSERGLVWALGVIPVILMLLLGGGMLDVPMNDEFSYARLADAFGRTGRIQLNGWGTPLMLPQMVIGAAIIKVFGFKHGRKLIWFVIDINAFARVIECTCRLHLTIIDFAFCLYLKVGIVLNTGIQIFRRDA